VILRCTAKLLVLLGARPGTLAERAPSDDDWYANLLWLDRRKCLLLVHGGTLFSVFTADIRKADLTPVGETVVELIHDALRDEELPKHTFGELEPRSVTLAKTASRLVLGYMNEMARFCEYAVFGAGGLDRMDIQALNRELRRELHLSRQAPGYIVPIELVRAGKSGVPPSELGPRLRVMS
jgi:hypothetical protein